MASENRGPEPAAGRAFADSRPAPHGVNFVNDVPYDDTGLEPFPKPRATSISLADVLSPDQIRAIQSANQIAFHMVGDTGGTAEPSPQLLVAQKMVEDFQQPPAPSFFYHLGDVVYNFGQERHYHDQFYDPYRHYPAPIFAIPGNHDGDMFPFESAKISLEGFLANFCTERPMHARVAGDYVRTTMTQPGVYFTLEAPFVSIIGLYTNALEGPGVLSAEGGRHPKLSNDQLDFLVTELKKPRSGALLLALHHTPISADADAGGSAHMLADLDACIERAGVWPDAVFAAHAHNYQRFTRQIGGRQIADRQVPYIVAGTGGHFFLTRMQKNLIVPLTQTGPRGEPITLDYFTDERHGYLRLIASPTTLDIEFWAVPPRLSDPRQHKQLLDACSLNLKTKRLIPQAYIVPPNREAAT